MGEPETPLSEAETAAIRAELDHYEDAQAAAVEALKIVQQARGWVDDARLQAVAGLLGLPAAELEGVATFYNLIFRRPVGRHVILVCDSVSCYIRGFDAVYQALQARLGVTPGQTTADGRFTLLPMCCLGHCDHAPAMTIDGEHHGDLTPEGLEAILQRYD